MEELLLSKTDLKKLAWFAVLLIIISFIGGYYIAELSNSKMELKLTQLESKISKIKLSEREAHQTEQFSIAKNALTAVAIEKPTTNSEFTSFRSPIKLNENNIILSADNPYGIQAGVFNAYKNAKSLHINLLNLGIENQIIVQEKNLSISYRIILQQFKSKVTALESLHALRDLYNMQLSLVSLKTWDTSKKVAMK